MHDLEKKDITSSLRLNSNLPNQFSAANERFQHLMVGEVLRVKAKGVPVSDEKNAKGDYVQRGDLLLQVQIIMPKKLSKDARKLIEELGKEGI